MNSTESNKEKLKKKNDAIWVVTAGSQIIKHKRKGSRVSNTRKRKCWVKLWLAEKDKSLYHRLVSEFLLHDKEESRMFLQMAPRQIRLASLCNQ